MGLSVTVKSRGVDPASGSVYSCVANRLMMERYAGTHCSLHVHLLLATFGKGTLAEIDVLGSFLCHDLED